MKASLIILLLSIAFLTIPVCFKIDDDVPEPKKPGESGCGPNSGETTVSFQKDIQKPILNGICAKCHSGSDASGDMDLSEGFSYCNIYNKKSSGYSPDIRVVPGNSEASVLYGKIINTGEWGGKMPPAGAGSLSDTEINNIKTWIDEGAIDN